MICPDALISGGLGFHRREYGKKLHYYTLMVYLKLYKAIKSYQMVSKAFYNYLKLFEANQSYSKLVDKLKTKCLCLSLCLSVCLSVSLYFCSYLSVRG